MKSVYTTLGFALGASAAALTARDQCCFGLTASGGVSGSVGQLSDGQNRIGQTAGLANQNGKYCISNGQITDGNGRGCILTPPTTQFQCDTGATPTGGFSVMNGNVQYNGSDKFYACPTGDNGGYNIYTVPVPNQQGCVAVTLSTGGQCSSGGSTSSAPASSAPASSAPASKSAPASSAPASKSAPASSAPASKSAPASSASAPPAPATPPPAMTTTVYVTVTGPCAASSTPMSSAPASSAPASSTPASSAPASSSAMKTSAPASSSAMKSSAPASSSSMKPSAPASSASACQSSLSGAYQTPHAIIPINSNSPTTSYGTQYNAYLGGGNSTIFNFDIPSSYKGMQCSVIFLFPMQKDLETSSFTTSGSGSLTFSLLSSAAPLTCSYNSAPGITSQLAQISNVMPGNSYVVSTAACMPGTTQSIEVSASSGFQLEFFEDWNPSPIGVFLTAC